MVYTLREDIKPRLRFWAALFIVFGSVIIVEQSYVTPQWIIDEASLIILHDRNEANTAILFLLWRYIWALGQIV